MPKRWSASCCGKNCAMTSKQPSRVIFLAGMLIAAAGCIPAGPLPTATSRPPDTSGSRPGKVSAEPAQILTKAIQALGGAEHLRRQRTNESTGQGRAALQSSPIGYRFKSYADLPLRYRDETEWNNGAKFVQIVNGDRGWVVQNNMVFDMDPVNLKSLQEMLHVYYILTLLPLREKDYTLASVPDQRQDGVMCYGFTVKAPGRADVTLFFERDTSLLLLVKTTAIDPNTYQPKVHETYFRDYEKLEGVLFPIRRVIYNDGNKVMEQKYEQVRWPDKMDDKLFLKP
jgi:hypothetical protein